MSASNAVLLVFAKAPVSGEVNTRLIPAIGVQAATRLQHDLIVHRMQQFAAETHFDTQLYCAPDTQHPLFRYCRQHYGVSLYRQTGENLGQRMAAALHQALQTYRYAVLIGTDAPAVGARTVVQALQALAQTDVVIQPAQDGGYVLIAMAAHHAGVFENIAWGSDQVLAQTRARIAAAGLRAFELPEAWDIDTAQDYRRYQRYRRQVLS